MGMIMRVGFVFLHHPTYFCTIAMVRELSVPLSPYMCISLAPTVLSTVASAFMEGQSLRLWDSQRIGAAAFNGWGVRERRRLREGHDRGIPDPTVTHGVEFCLSPVLPLSSQRERKSSLAEDYSCERCSGIVGLGFLRFWGCVIHSPSSMGPTS
eukprot:RCo004300